MQYMAKQVQKQQPENKKEKKSKRQYILHVMVVERDIYSWRSAGGRQPKRAI